MYVPQEIRGLQSRISACYAYRRSLEDSKRQHPTYAEVCKFDWRFRFKPSAGEHWTSMDPFYTENDHKACKVARTVVRRFTPCGHMTSGCVSDALPPPWGDAVDIDNFRWTAEERVGFKGELIKRVKVNEYPSYLTSRHPVNWGFIMQSCWVLWTSFPMPAMGADTLLDNDLLNVSVDDQISEVRWYNFGSLVEMAFYGNDEQFVGLDSESERSGVASAVEDEGPALRAPEDGKIQDSAPNGDAARASRSRNHSQVSQVDEEDGKDNSATCDRKRQRREGPRL